MWRLECVPEKASSDNQFLGIYVMSFNTAANAAQFVSETRHFEDGENDENMTTITLTCLPWSDVRKHISVDLRYSLLRVSPLGFQKRDDRSTVYE